MLEASRGASQERKVTHHGASQLIEEVTQGNRRKRVIAGWSWSQALLSLPVPSVSKSQPQDLWASFLTTCAVNSIPPPALREQLHAPSPFPPFGLSQIIKVFANIVSLKNKDLRLVIAENEGFALEEWANLANKCKATGCEEPSVALWGMSYSVWLPLPNSFDPCFCAA